MYHYLFTNDLRISQLSSFLQNAAICIKEDRVPSAADDKSANNNITTLAFYFNLIPNGNCTEAAASGDTRSVVLNFIKKFQFPNPRTSTSYMNAIRDGIKLAPMRMIVRILYTLLLEYGYDEAYLTKDEIRYFVFYNDLIAKKDIPEISNTITQILSYRKNGVIPSNVSKNEEDHEWNHEERQIREMLKILNWSGCAVYENGQLVVKDETLTEQNKAEIFDILRFQEFWEDETRESYQTYMDMSDKDVKMLSEKSAVTDNNKCTGADNTLLYGVPGTGKSYIVKKEYCNDSNYMERVVFHPDYTYADFVGQILPRVEEGELQYVFSPGPFTNILSKAWKDPYNKYYLIIEEINRGNAPAIFGEVFQLLDRKTELDYPKDEVGESEYEITNYDISNIVYGDSAHKIRIPSNLYIVATMNTSDQNVFTLDTAFQRRWNMRYVRNDISKASHANSIIEGTGISWKTFSIVVNNIIAELDLSVISSEDKRLGAYFVRLNELKSDKFAEKVLKYLWDDAFKMNRSALFNDRFSSLGDVIEAYKSTSEDKLKAVLRSDVYQRMISNE